MASVHSRTAKDGTTTWQVKWREGGAQRSKACPSEKAAKRVKAIVEAHGTFVDLDAAAQTPTLGEWVDHYLAHNTRANEGTIRDYRRILDQHVIPQLGELPLPAVTADVLRRWVNGLETVNARGQVGPMADKTRSNVFGLLSAVLGTAVEARHLTGNPCKSIRLRKTDRPASKALIAPGDLHLILKEIPEQYRPLVVLLAGCGLRWGEAAGLNVGDVDLLADPPILRITRAVKHRARQADEPGLPKTTRSVRELALPPAVVEALAPLVMRPADEPLFVNSRGKRLRNSTFHTAVWQPALKRASDPEKYGPAALTYRPRIHDLRAFTTTWMIDAGVPVDVVADYLGHEHIGTTFGIYRRVNRESSRKAAAAMQGVLRVTVDEEPQPSAQQSA